MKEPKASREHQIRTNVARSAAAKKARRNWAKAQRARSVTAPTHVPDSVRESAPVNLDFTD
jgi:hypothetical protein